VSFALLGHSITPVLPWEHYAAGADQRAGRREPDVQHPADSGYTIDRVLVDGVSVGQVSSYTFTNVQAAHTIASNVLWSQRPPTPPPAWRSPISRWSSRLSAPANIMVVLDDSGSMDWEILIPNSTTARIRMHPIMPMGMYSITPAPLGFTAGLS